MSDGFVNIFNSPMSFQEQCELSNLLDGLTQLYENGFFDCVNNDDDNEGLLDEFEALYDMVKMLQDREMNRMDSEVN